jgi:hypothetical protein
MARLPSTESLAGVTFRHMTGLPHPEPRKTAHQARQLALAIDAIEARLDALELGAPPDAVARALEAPVRVFDAAAKEALA